MSDPGDRSFGRPRYRVGRSELDEALDRVLDLLPDDARRAERFVREILVSGVKLALDDASPGDVKLINSAVKELRFAAKVFSPYRGVRKVSVFGSARTEARETAYQQAVAFGARMAELGWMVITGAGGGIMEAAHGGAGREASFGVNIHLPFEQEANETVRGGDRLVNFKYFFTRKLTFLKETDAVVLFPGGFGTHDEGFETLTLIQTGKADPLPVVFVEPPGSDYWREWHEYVERHLLAPGLISPTDTSLYKIVDDVGAAVDEVLAFYRVYHSQRYVGDRLVLRLLAPLPAARLVELEAEFEHLVREGRMELTEALPEEAGQPELAHLPRLVFHFTRDDFAGLRRLIDRINETPIAADEQLPEVGPHPDDERADRGATPQSHGRDDADAALEADET